MKAFLSIVVVFSFAITAGSSLTCNRCVSYNETNCQGPPVACNDGVENCVSAISVVIKSGNNFTTVLKACGMGADDLFNYTMTYNDTYEAQSSQICHTDNCNNDIPDTYSRNLTENGVVCPFCFKEGLDGCTPAGEMKCTGLETKCFQYSWLTFGDNGQSLINASYQGCATPSACTSSTLLEVITCREDTHHY